MSVFDSTFPNKDNNTLQKKHPSVLLSLNDVLKESLKKAQSQDQLQLIVRCETLPYVAMDHEEIVQLFDDLLAMILTNHSGISRLFLYVDCEEEDTDAIDMSLEEGYRRYIIKFYTNIATHGNWKLINSQALINCRHILARHGGNLIVNDISSTGCLFLLSLPGKMSENARN